jgi:tetratricopeptide (TPR) repeat protein
LEDKGGLSNILHQIGNVHYLKGDYEAALTNFKKSMEIDDKIGYIAGTAISMGQMGKVLSIKGQHKNALKLCIQSYLIFVKLESPNAKIVKGFIKNIWKNCPKNSLMQY